jgi:KaiC/GvpD/RAD55 family RecA-like ATPase
MERLKTGIPGLDEIMDGGIPAGSIVLVSGTAGSGKTTLGTQFAFSGASKFREPSIYLTLEEDPDSIRGNSLNFGWDFGPLEKRGIFGFVKYDRYHLDEIPRQLEVMVRDTGAKRAVIDTISALSFMMRDKNDYRRMLFGMSRSLKKLGCTTMLLSETVPGVSGLSRHGIAEFIADSILALNYSRVFSSFERAIHVWKMRGSEHSMKLHPFKIAARGM